MNAGYDYDAPLLWCHEEGRAKGTEVSQIPPSGRILFFDSRGAVARLDDVTEARWLVKQIHFLRADQLLPVRITRLVGTHEDSPGDGYWYILPNPGQQLVYHCTRDKAHDGCGVDTCLVLEAAVKHWIEEPIVAALKGAA